MKRTKTLDLALISIFAALTAIGAFIKIPLPYVPFTLQVFFVFLAGSLLGSKRGFQSQLVYVCIGLIGLPVFTQGGGFGYIFQPTFGYLIGFVIAAYVIGKIIERFENPTSKHFIFANFVGLAIVYGIGVPYIYLAFHTWMGLENSWGYVLMIGFASSIGGDIFISIVTGILASKLYKVFSSQNSLVTRHIKGGN